MSLGGANRIRNLLKGFIIFDPKGLELLADAHNGSSLCGPIRLI
jgi:hypothetical protein